MGKSGWIAVIVAVAFTGCQSGDLRRERDEARARVADLEARVTAETKRADTAEAAAKHPNEWCAFDCYRTTIGKRLTDPAPVGDAIGALAGIAAKGMACVDENCTAHEDRIGCLKTEDQTEKCEELLRDSDQPDAAKFCRWAQFLMIGSCCAGGTLKGPICGAYKSGRLLAMDGEARGAFVRAMLLK